MLAVAGEASFDSRSALSQLLRTGFLAQLVSSLLSGFRWILTQVFIKGQVIGSERFVRWVNIRPLVRGLSATETIGLTAPYTLLCVLPFVVGFEGAGIWKWVLEAEVRHIVNLMIMLMIIGVCVYGLLWAEYELVKVTSSLTVSVGFVLKEVIVIFAGAIIFNDHLSIISYCGFVIVQCGILGYALQQRQ